MMFSFFKSKSTRVADIENPLNYDQLIPLDAEELAEGGIEQAYQDVVEALRVHVTNPVELTSQLTDNSYRINAGGVSYIIYGPDLDDHSWERATYALFDIINRQLMYSNVRFYAINSGNDLAGMFLTEAEFQQALKALPKKSDWPYIPSNSPPNFGFQS